MEKMPEAMLLGRFDVKVDKRGCVCIPSEWRKAMGSPSQAYLVKDVHEQCLDLIPKGQFDEYASSDIADPAESAIRDRIKQEAQLVSIGDRGRMRLDQNLRLEVAIHDTVGMVGEMRYIKLWNPDMLARESELSAEELNPLFDVLDGGVEK